MISSLTLRRVPRRTLLASLALCALAMVPACKRSRAPGAGDAGTGAAAAAGETTYERACAEPSLRAGYLASVVSRARERIPAYLVGIDYLDERAARALLGDPAVRAHPGMATLAGDPADRRPAYAGQRSSRVVVLPGAFDCARVGGELAFLLGLLDHELVHAHQAQGGLKQVPTATLMALPSPTATWLYDHVAELEAYRNELGQAASYRLPAAYYEVAIGRYLHHYLQLFDRGHAIGDALREELLVAFFEDWMLEQERIFVRDGDQWRFELEGASYRFPAAVVRQLEARARDAGPG